jgi:hypothetical protein
METRHMKRTLLRFGWARSIGALLTLVGVAVVFVVVILPTTAFGSSKAAKGGCKISFKKFSTEKDARDDDGADETSTVAIYGSNLDRVDRVQFGGPSNEAWITASSFTFVQPGGYIITQPNEDSLGVKGRIRLIDFGPSPDCIAVSKSQFTPPRTSQP